MREQTPLVSVVIPALNEAGTIEAVIKQIKQYSPYPTEVIVVDGGSKDGTAEKALNNGAKVIHDPRPGYGRAIRTGLENTSGEIIVIIDADGTYETKDLPNLLEPLVQGEADVVLASRLGGKILPEAMPGLNYVGNRIFSLLYDKLYKQNVIDTQTGYRAITREAFKKFTLQEDGMSISMEIMIQAAKTNQRIHEFPSTYKMRKVESTTKLHPFRDGFKILYTLIRHRL